MIRSTAHAWLGGPDAQAGLAADCLAAAAAFRDRASELARDALGQAFQHVISSEHLIGGADARAVAEAALEHVRVSGSTSVTDLLLTGLATLVVNGYETAVPHIHRGVSALIHPETPDAEVLANFLLGVTSCTVMLDDASRDVLLRRVDEIARRTGALRIA